ncbi:MAG: CZB domain-containing protein [Pseudomonadota bacterium]
MKSNSFLMFRLNDHIQYMKKIQRTLSDKSDFKGLEHQHCKLGEWLYGDGIEEIKSTNNKELEEIFQSLYEPHKKYHDASKKALQHHNENNEKEARQYETKMIVISSILVNLLLKLDASAKN